MKVDIDSYLYIFITIIILIITALGRKKKKSAKQVQEKPDVQSVAAPAEQEYSDPYEEGVAEKIETDPFERLEKLFAPQETIFTAQEQEPEPAVAKIDTETELKSINEEEEAKRKIHKAQMHEEMQQAFKLDSDEEIETGQRSKEKHKISLLKMFDDPEDIKKAIIYSEIFNKKYF